MTHVHDNDPRDGRGGSLPRLLDADLNEIARIETDNVSLELNLRPLSTAHMVTHPGQHEIRVRDFMELFSPAGSVGLYRVTDVETTYGYYGKQDLYLEHALTTLGDSLTLDMQTMTGTVREVFTALLQCQRQKYWVLGDCDVPDEYELAYEANTDTVLSTLMGLYDMLPEGYAIECNTLAKPFVLNIRALPAERNLELRMSRNINDIKVHIDDSDLCTRLVPYGAGEGSDRIGLESLTGQKYIDSDTVDTWRIVEKTFVYEDIFDSLTLKDVSERYLDRHKNPRVSVEVSAIDLYSATGEVMDRIQLGGMCSVPLPAYGVSMLERVVSAKYDNVYKSPEKVFVTLANKITNASDELGNLMREATGSKLLGGKVEETKTEYNNSYIGMGEALAHYFDVEGYGNVLAVLVKYTPAGGCTINVDGLGELPAEVIKEGSFDALKYLKKDENGIPTVGQHRIVYFGPLNDFIAVHSEVTVKTIGKR